MNVLTQSVSGMTPNVLTETRRHQTILNSKLIPLFFWFIKKLVTGSVHPPLIAAFFIDK